jgi:tetratricopeptide (TPR) repeat protein
MKVSNKQHKQFNRVFNERNKQQGRNQRQIKLCVSMKKTKALEYYYQALDANPTLPQAFNNIAVIYHYRGEKSIEAGDRETAELLFEKASEYWREAIRLAPSNYLEAANWINQRE